MPIEGKDHHIEQEGTCDHVVAYIDKAFPGFVPVKEQDIHHAIYKAEGKGGE